VPQIDHGEPVNATFAESRDGMAVAEQRIVGLSELL